LIATPSGSLALPALVEPIEAFDLTGFGSALTLIGAPLASIRRPLSRVGLSLALIRDLIAVGGPRGPVRGMLLPRLHGGFTPLDIALPLLERDVLRHRLGCATQRCIALARTIA
jgi:hypothetical protein